MSDRTRRLLITVLWGGLGFYLLMALLGAPSSSVLARQGGATELEGEEGLLQAPSGWQTLLLDTFTSGEPFSGTITSSGSTNRFWGVVTVGTAELLDTLWSVQDGTGPKLIAGVNDYPGNVTTTLTYGPINMNVTAVEVQFAHWIATVAPDGLEWGYSTTGSGDPFVYTAVSPAQASTWETTTLTSGPSGALASLLGQESVYLAFRFHSNDDGQVDKGVFLDNVRVRVQEEINPAFDALSPVCLGQTIHLSDTSSATSGIDHIEWNFGDGTTGTAPVTDHLYAHPGTYTVWLTATSEVGTQRAVSKPVSVQSATADISPAGGSFACLGVPTTFSDASVVTGTVAAWHWRFGDDGSTATTPSAVHTFNTVGTYDVTLVVTTTAGCSDQKTIQIQVATPPSPAIAASPQSTQVGVTVFFTDTSGTDADLRQWDFGDGTVTAPSEGRYAQHAFRYGGPKTVVVTTTSAATGCSGSAQKTVYITDKIYLPLLARERFSYRDDFSDHNSGWPTWSKKTYNSNGSEAENHRGGYLLDLQSAQVVSALGLEALEPGIHSEILDDGSWTTYQVDGGPQIAADMGIAVDNKVFYEVVRDDGDEVFVTGPELMPANFTYEAWLRYSYLSGRFWGNEVGLLITKDPVDPSDAHTVQGYSFQVQFNPSTDGGWAPSQFVIKEWNVVNWSGGADRKFGYDRDNDGYFKRDIGKWNKFTIVRNGSNMKWYVNDHYVAEFDDSTYSGPVYIGFFTAHSRDGSFDILFEFDDVYVRAQ